MSWHLLTGVLGVFDIISIISSLFKSCKNTLPRTTIGDSLLAGLSSITNYHSNVIRVGEIEIRSRLAAVTSLLYLHRSLLHS